MDLSRPVYKWGTWGTYCASPTQCLSSFQICWTSWVIFYNFIVDKIWHTHWTTLYCQTYLNIFSNTVYKCRTCGIYCATPTLCLSSCQILLTSWVIGYNFIEDKIWNTHWTICTVKPTSTSVPTHYTSVAHVAHIVPYLHYANQAVKFYELAV